MKKNLFYLWILLGYLMIHPMNLMATEIALPIDLETIELEIEATSDEVLKDESVKEKEANQAEKPESPSGEEETKAGTEKEAEPAPKKVTEEELKETLYTVIKDMMDKRYAAILAQDSERLHELYDTRVKTGLYAFESEAIKMKYLKNWSEKQNAVFTDVQTTVHIRKVRDRDNGLYGMTCNVSTAFTYVYNEAPDVPNTFKLGTSHYIHLKKQEDGSYRIIKEWYTDPFADSLDLENIKSDEMKQYIGSHKKPNYTPDERTQKAIEYAHTYCGIGDGENLFKYNTNYLDCNPRGGDCANFASQILHEGGKFKKTDTWNYTNDGSKAWVNAQAFKNYMVHSGRGSYVSKGAYKSIYKSAYQLRPGDFVAYEKKGRITHISTVTGLDSKGYPLVTCHNTDRLLVPYDLGWSNKNITFHLIDMHY